MDLRNFVKYGNYKIISYEYYFYVNWRSGGYSQNFTKWEVVKLWII